MLESELFLCKHSYTLVLQTSSKVWCMRKWKTAKHLKTRLNFKVFSFYVKYVKQSNDIYICFWLWYRDNAVWSGIFPFPVSKISHAGTIEGKVFPYKSKSRWQNGFGIVFPLSTQVRLLTALWAEKGLSTYLYLCDQYIFCTSVCTQLCIYIYAAKLKHSILVSIKVSKASFVSYFIAVFLKLSKSKTNLWVNILQFLSY